jgi:hypothetical protein
MSSASAPSESPRNALRTRGVSATISRAASFGLAVVLVLLAVFTLSSSLVSNRRASDVAQAVRLNNAYRDARLAATTAESMERKYRLEPSPEVRAGFDKATTRLKTALESIIASGDSAGADPAHQAMARFDIYRQAMGRMFSAIDAKDTTREPTLKQMLQATPFHASSAPSRPSRSSRPPSSFSASCCSGSSPGPSERTVSA